jgi:hypothetical protein
MKITPPACPAYSNQRTAFARRCAAPTACYALAASLMVALAPMPAAAAVSVFGSLANFDTVNDTGKPAYGFEIEIEDSTFFKGSVGSVFGLNRSFGGVAGGNPLGVVRFGSANVTDYNDALGNHAGVHIIYGGTIGAISTPANDPLHPYNTPGESCWPGANANWQANPCDHFGITTAGSPAKTTYSWLVQSTVNPTLLDKQLVGIPAVSYVYTPAPAPQPGMPLVAAQVKVQIQAIAPNPEQPENIDLWGQAFWVKTYTTKVNKNIDLGNLLRGDPEAEKAEVESEWSIFQMAPAGHGAGANEVKEKNIGLSDADKAIIRRYEFYKYVGTLNVDGSGEVDCNTACETDPVGQKAVGNFVGAQIAGFNAVQAVPEPQTWALMLAGIGLLGALLRRRN